jgi:DNA invertase Pin-like site-specific DNA recombinase
MTTPARIKRTAKAQALPTIPPTARCLIYRRVSTDDQAKDDRASLAEQERQCRALAAERGITVDALWDDRGISGRDESRLERLTAWCEQHPRKGTERGLILVLKRDRWARFVHDDNAAAYYEYRLARAGWDVEFALERRSGNRTADAVTATLHGRLASAESEERARRTRVGMLKQARLGRWQGRAPYGYAREARNDATGRTRPLAPYEHSGGGEWVKLVPGPVVEVRTVKRIFAEAAKGETLEAIARRLTRDGVPGPWTRYTGNWRREQPPEWIFDHLATILRNRTYLGEVRHRPRTEKVPGQRRHRLPPSEWIVVEGAHAALVDREVFDRVQALFRRRAGRRQRIVHYLLTGLLRCAGCGGVLGGGGGTRPKAPDPLKYTTYTCRRCKPQATINRAWLEEKVIAAVSAHARQMVDSGAFDRALDEARKAQRGTGRDRRADLQKELTAMRQQRERLVRAVADGLLTPDEAKVTLDNVRRVLADLEAETQSGRFHERRVTVTAQERRDLKALARDFATRIARATPEAVRELLSLWVTEVSVDTRNPLRRTARLVLWKVPVSAVAGLATQQSGSLSPRTRAGP